MLFFDRCPWSFSLIPCLSFVGNGKGEIVVNYFDKTVFLKNRELGFSGAVVSLKMAIRMGVFGCFYAFNIFWAAFVGRRCRIFLGLPEFGVMVFTIC